MEDTRDVRSVRPASYFYRRELRARELLPALGLGVAAGLAAFYLARLMIQRTPLLDEERGASRVHRPEIKPATRRS